MTLTCDLDLDILKAYQKKFIGQGFRKLLREPHRHTERDGQRDTQTDATETILTPHSRRVVKSMWLNQREILSHVVRRVLKSFEQKELAAMAGRN